MRVSSQRTITTTLISLGRRAAVALPIVILAWLPAVASAQFGFPGQYNLPQNDFRWVWGRDSEAAFSRFEDFSIRGGESGFDCTLRGGLSPASRMSRVEIRDLESDLRTSLFFIQSSANAMYILDQQRDLDWAVLECAKQEAEERTAEESAERESKARARAERRRDRRRAREAGEEDDSD
jgi:hypothetical protein